MNDGLRARRFTRQELTKEIPEKAFDELVKETEDFLKRRFNKLAIQFDDISKTNFNPFLLLTTSPVYNLFSPFEVAERLQLSKAFHGDDTAFGRMAEERYLKIFGAKTPSEKAKNKTVWTPIDVEMTIENQRYLMSIKSGPWTMNQEHANAMILNFPKIHDDTNARIIIGITYGKYQQLNNKPALERFQ
jgi:hypothetical protein